MKRITTKNKLEQTRTVSLRKKMLAMLVSMILVSMSALIICSSSLASSAMKKNIDESLLKLAQESAEKVDATVGGYFTELSVLSSNDAFRNPEANLQQIAQLASNEMQVTDSTSIFLLNANGDTVYSSSGSTDNYADRSYFRSAVSGTKCVSDPLVSKVDGTVIVVVAVPVKGTSGTINGVLCAVKDATAFSTDIAGITYGETGYAYMISTSGVIVAHPNEDKVLSQENVLEYTDPDQAELLDISKKMANGESGTGEYTYQGDTKFMAYAPLKNISWSIAVTAPKSEVFAGLHSLNRMMILIGIVCVLIAVAVVYLIASGIVKPINQAVAYSADMEQGNFSVRISEDMLGRRDELGALACAFEKMSVGLSNTLGSMKAAAEQVSAGAHQVSDSSISLSQGATEQASSIEELSASIEEIAAQTRQNADNAKQADELSSKTKQDAAAGKQQMQNMLGAMEEINQSSNNIFQIIKTIEDISFQTNILALNAAVEAARAGEHGKGFAVVAEEVRNLAARSSEAAQETTEMIQDSIAKVGEGSKIAHMTSEALNEIVEQIDQVAVLVEDIANASNEQSVGIGQINEGIAQISAVVESNSAVAEESAASSEELAGQAQLLNGQVEHFKLRERERDYTKAPTEILQKNNSIAQEDNSKY